jgi:hypothetical protein
LPEIRLSHAEVSANAGFSGHFSFIAIIQP